MCRSGPRKTVHNKNLPLFNMGGGGGGGLKRGSAELLNSELLRVTRSNIEIIIDWCTEHLLLRGSREPPSAKLFKDF